MYAEAKRNMSNPEANQKKVADFLQTLTRSGGLSLTWKIAFNGASAGLGADPAGDAPRDPSEAAPELPPASSSDQAPSPLAPPEISVELSGPDVPLLLARNGELLLAIEHLAAKILRFEHEEHDRISFDANNFKLLRHQELRMAAQVAIERVRRTGQPFSFAPMSSRERRILHLELANSGLQTSSSGEGSRRFVVLYPEGTKTPPVATEERTKAIRSTFRRR
jgi:spoIIIJ-associated protein